MTGIAHTNIFQEGSVYINGEEWSAWSRNPIPVETRVRIIGRQGLVLEVEAVKE